MSLKHGDSRTLIRGTILFACALLLAATGLVVFPARGTGLFESPSAIHRDVPPAESGIPSSPEGLEEPVAIEQEIPIVSLAEAQEHAPFAIPQPAWVPEGLSLLDAHIGNGPFADDLPASVGVTLNYGYADSGDWVMSLEVTDGAPMIDLYPVSSPREAVVKGIPATLIKGAWDETGVWNPDADSSLLMWADGQLNLALSASGLAEPTILRVANSIQVN